MDFLGFALSDKPRPHRYGLLEQAELVQTVVDEAGVSGPVVVLAHDGTSVTTEQLTQGFRARRLAASISRREQYELVNVQHWKDRLHTQRGLATRSAIRVVAQFGLAHLCDRPTLARDHTKGDERTCPGWMNPPCQNLARGLPPQ